VLIFRGGLPTVFHASCLKAVCTVGEISGESSGFDGGIRIEDEGDDCVDNGGVKGDGARGLI
jgi:hypothetical protein